MNLKHTALILLFFLCFSIFFTGCGTLFMSKESNVEIRALTQEPSEKQEEPDESKTTETTTTTTTVTDNGNNDKSNSNNNTNNSARFVPVTWDIVNGIQNFGMNLKDLHFYLSKPFFITITEQNNAPRRFEVNEGTLIVSREENKSPRRIEFTVNDIGALRNITSENGFEIFVIFKDIPLRFTKNSQGRYDLLSAEIESSTYELHSEDEVPQLYIFAEINENMEMRTTIANSTQGDSNNNIRDDGGRQSYQAINIGNFADHRPSRDIDGQSYVNRDGITAYVIFQNSSVNRETLNRLINTYIFEAGYEGINLDIAIAQMLYATDFLRNRQRMTTYNYAALSAAPGWNGRFSNMTEGVRAHIQHLKGYASTQRPKTRIVDPRYQILADLGYQGRMRTFDQLFRVWSESPASYGNRINEILNGLYRFSD